MPGVLYQQLRLLRVFNLYIQCFACSYRQPTISLNYAAVPQVDTPRHIAVPLAKTSNGNCYGGSIGVATSVGYRVGKTIDG